eukprot:3253392-Pleurochrysis_carterae.AAC.1
MCGELARQPSFSPWLSRARHNRAGTRLRQLASTRMFNEQHLGQPRSIHCAKRHCSTCQKQQPRQRFTNIVLKLVPTLTARVARQFAASVVPNVQLILRVTRRTWLHTYAGRVVVH